MKNSTPFSIGVDIGGSHITAAAVLQTSGKILDGSSSRAQVDSHGSAEEILSIWANTIQAALSSMSIPKSELHGLGLAMPGPFDYNHGISLMTAEVAKYENLYSINIRNELAHRLKLDPSCIRFRNDAEAFLDGEMNYGAGKGFKSAIGITLGTGLGTAFYHHQRSVDLGFGLGLRLHDGLAEDFISTRWFLKRYEELTQRSINGVKALVEMHPTDSTAKAIFKEFEMNISQFLGDAIAEILRTSPQFMPESIIIGGNIALASDLFFSGIQKHLKKIYPGLSIQLRRSMLNEQAALIGATVSE